MCFSQTPPPSPSLPLSPPSVTQTIDETGIAPESGGVDKNPDKPQINSFTGNGTEKGQNSSTLPEEKRRRLEMKATPTAKDASVSVEDVAASIPGAAEEKVLITHIVDPINIRAGTSRSDEIKLGFYRERFSKEDAQLLLQQKHSKLVEKGYTTLIGRIARNVAANLKNSPCEYVEKTRFTTQVTFIKSNQDLMALGCGKYKDIIERMYGNRECSPRTAFYILKNLSKGYDGKRDYELFLDLPENAKDLMAVLICEAIRFQEDGALARMAIRKVLSLFPKPSTREPVAEDYSDEQPAESLEKNPFYEVFVSIEETTLDDTTPFAIFAATQDKKRVGGKRRKLDLIEGEISIGNTHYEFDKNRLFDTVDCLSDSEEQKEEKGDDTETDVDQTKSQSPSNPDSEEQNGKAEETQAVLGSPHTLDGEEVGGYFLRKKTTTPLRYRPTPSPTRETLSSRERMAPRRLFSKEADSLRGKKNTRQRKRKIEVYEDNDNS